MRRKRQDLILGMDAHSVILTMFFGPVILTGALLLIRFAGLKCMRLIPADPNRCPCGAVSGPLKTSGEVNP